MGDRTGRCNIIIRFIIIDQYIDRAQGNLVPGIILDVGVDGIDDIIHFINGIPCICVRRCG